MRINATTLPAPAEIDQIQIREAAEQFSTATAAFREQQRALAKLDEPAREMAKDADAKDAEAALAAGKPAPKRRHVIEFNRSFDDQEHEVRVAQLASKRALDAFQTTVDAHSEEWSMSIEKRIAMADEAYLTAVDKLEQTHQERILAYRRGAIVGHEVPAISAVRLKPASLHGVDLAYLPDPRARVNQRAVVVVEEVLEALRSMGVDEEPTLPSANIDAGQVTRAFDHAREVGRVMREGVKPLTAQPLTPERAGAILDAASHAGPAVDRRDKVEERRAELLAQEAVA